MNKPTNEIIFHAVKNELPEENISVLWWYKGDGSPPYCGSMCDCDFPEIDDFFAWCEIPHPTPAFVDKYNKGPLILESGYYWVKTAESDPWKVFRYHSDLDCWYCTGNEHDWYGGDLFHINENRLTTPDQEAGEK